MSESFVRVAADGVGKRIRNRLLAAFGGGDDVYQQVVSIADPDGPLLEMLSSAPAADTGQVAIPVRVISQLSSVIKQEVFTDVALDVNGEATVALGTAPSVLKSCFAVCRQDLRKASVTALAGSTITVKVRKMQYERATVGNTSAQNPPAGVTLRTAVGNTGDPTVDGTNAATVDAIGGSGNAVNRPSYDSHVHPEASLYQHGHNVTQTFTDAPVAASETVDILVIYQ